ncbi:hypothetical protein KK449_18510 [Clostridioides difficile]|nr:hypothetical protein [Clostridioides difficile]MBT2146432.1 hypothetical protein [Clostridioides difficile]MBT2158421.1 hypothetical protein [Clostridioides difficile]MBT2159543.1 hypothetical protein [Clostridioides difficile]
MNEMIEEDVEDTEIIKQVLTQLEEKRLIFSLNKKYSISRLQKKHFLKGYLQVRG